MSSLDPRIPKKTPDFTLVPTSESIIKLCVILINARDLDVNMTPPTIQEITLKIIQLLKGDQALRRTVKTCVEKDVQVVQFIQHADLHNETTTVTYTAEEGTVVLETGTLNPSSVNLMHVIRSLKAVLSLVVYVQESDQ